MDRSPFGSETQWYWDRRTEYFDRFDDGIQTDAEGLYSVVPREIGIRQASQFRSLDVVDAFAGIGGNAIAFALSGKAVVAIELDPSRFQMAVNNAELYGVSRSIDFVEGDCREHLVLLAGDRALYLDPPWGGRSYLRNHKFLLEHFSPDGHELLDLTLERYAEVLLRVPRTFDASQLRRYGRAFEVTDDLSKGRLISRSVYFG